MSNQLFIHHPRIHELYLVVYLYLCFNHDQQHVYNTNGISVTKFIFFTRDLNESILANLSTILEITFPPKPSQLQEEVILFQLCMELHSLILSYYSNHSNRLSWSVAYVTAIDWMEPCLMQCATTTSVARPSTMPACLRFGGCYRSHDHMITCMY